MQGRDLIKAEWERKLFKAVKPFGYWVLLKIGFQIIGKATHNHYLYAKLDTGNLISASLPSKVLTEICVRERN